MTELGVCMKRFAAIIGFLMLSASVLAQDKTLNNYSVIRLETAVISADGRIVTLDADSVKLTGGIGSTDYASQATAWWVTDAGGADFRYLFVDEMHAKRFIADLEQALAGGQIISKSVAVVALAFTCPTAGTASTSR